MELEKFDNARLEQRLQDINDINLIDSFTKLENVEQTALLRAQMTTAATESHHATVTGCAAFERLLGLAETRDSGQIKIIADFLCHTWHRERDNRFDIFRLRSLDKAIADDIIAVINTIRWGELGVENFTENSAKRMLRMLKRWGLLE